MKQVYRKFFAAVTLIVCATIAQAQQDVQFSQYIFNGLSINPAYAGYKEDPYLNLNLRQQWLGIAGSPLSGMLSYDQLIAKQATDKMMGVGVQAFFDKLGPQQSINITGSYSVRIKLNQEDSKRLSFGVGFSMTQYQIDGTILQGSQFDPTLPPGIVSTNFVPDAQFGVYYNSPYMYLGASVLDLFTTFTNRTLQYEGMPNYQPVLRRTSHLYISGGGLVPIGDVTLKPSVLIKSDFANPTTVDLNVFALLNRMFWVGASYRSSYSILAAKSVNTSMSNNAASAMVEFYPNSNMRIGVSYDVPIGTSIYGTVGTGSMELSVGYVFSKKRRIIRIQAPRYF